MIIKMIKEHNGLPDPFEKKDGTRIKDQKEWEEHRWELKQLLADEMYGQMLELPGEVRGVLVSSRAIYHGMGIREEYVLKDNRGLTIRVSLTRPADEGEYPCIVWNQFSDMEDCPIEQEVLARKYSILSFDRTQFAPDEEGCKHFDGGETVRYYPEFSKARAVQLWAWGLSYCISWLETQSWCNKDFIAAGFSRGGKAAFCAAAYDERIKLCTPVSSGIGGSTCFRYSGGRLGMNVEESESLGYMLRADRFWYWYADGVKEYGDGKSFGAKGRETELPFDLHTLRALIAPRGIICIEGLSDNLSDAYGAQVTWRAAQEVYEFLEAQGKNGLAFMEGGHEFTAERWQVILDFAEVILRGKKQEMNYRRFERRQEEPLGTAKTIPALHFDWRSP